MTSKPVGKGAQITFGAGKPIQVGEVRFREKPEERIVRLPFPNAPLIIEGLYTPEFTIEYDPVLKGLINTVQEVKMWFPCWDFPVDRFVVYGPEDEWWAIPLGFGRWGQKEVKIDNAVLTYKDSELRITGTIRAAEL